MLARERPAAGAGGVTAAGRGRADDRRRGPRRNTATGRRRRNTARSGIRRSPPAGCRTATATGPMWRPGAGPGSTRTLGLRAVPLRALGADRRPLGLGAGGAWHRRVRMRPPVYAPALVTFFGIAAGVAIGAAMAPSRLCRLVPAGLAASRTGPGIAPARPICATSMSTTCAT